MQIGICGHFSESAVALNGQTVKTKILTEALEEIYGKESIVRCDTHNWKKRIFAFGASCLKLLFCCKNIVMLPAQSAVLTLFPLFVTLNRLFGRKIHYYVVGGWLQESIEKHPKLLRYLQRIHGIYVELHAMERDLKALGLSNVYYVSKFRKLQIIPEEEIPTAAQLPLRFCLFSRIMKEKGVEDAIESVQQINSKHGAAVCQLDIYGQVDPGYQQRFDEICRNLPQGVCYKGFVDFSRSGQVLRQYDGLLFPTYYEGEGYANTIVDAYASALPVIATDWKYNGEVVSEGSDGRLYDYRCPEKLTQILEEYVADPGSLLKMRKNARLRAFDYEPTTAITALRENIDND